MYPVWLVRIMENLASIGLNTVGSCDGSSYRHLLSDCQSAIVFANGGTALWDVFLEDLRQNPQHLRNHTHPLDDFVKRQIQKFDPNPTDNRRWIHCAAQTDTFIDFRPLAEQAGLGTASPLGLLIHPQYGLWLSLRAVLLTTERVPFTSVLQDSPCTSCTRKPCIAACPAQAVHPQKWSIHKCLQYHKDSHDCHDLCHSRLRCPVGKTHQHTTLQHLYHSNTPKGRKALADLLSIEDPLCKETTPWFEW